MQQPSDRLPSQAELDAQRQREQQQEESRQSLLSQILAPEARARLSRIALVKAEKARAVEDLIIQAVRSGRIRGGTGPGGRIGEKDVISVLEQVEGTKQEQQVIFQRKQVEEESDEESALYAKLGGRRSAKQDSESDFD